MLKLKLQYSGHLMRRADSFKKTLMLGKIEGKRRRGHRGWDSWMASPTPRGYSNSCPLRRWCHPIISSSVIPFSSRLQSSPTSGSFPVSRLFASGGQRIGASASASVLPMNIQDWFPLGNGLVGYPCSPRDSQESSPTPQFKSINSSALSFLHSPTLATIQDYWKNHSLD